MENQQHILYLNNKTICCYFIMIILVLLTNNFLIVIILVLIFILLVIINLLILLKIKLDKEKIIKKVIINIIESCCICLDDIRVNTIAGQLKCEHIFHIHCIKEWCLNNNTCPLCRKSIYKQDNQDNELQEEI